MTNTQGPLQGFKLIEIAGIGPTQLTGMLLADMGAEIIRIERPLEVDLGVAVPARFNLMNRSRGSLALDLKHPRGVQTVLRLCQSADALFEGFRPGVMEGLGLGPDECLALNPALVYARMTGWGQQGPMARQAGHDPNYIAIAGALGLIGESDGAPVYPLNVIGDFGGGALYLAMGLLAALLETSKSGQGQVVDVAMVDGVASLLTYFYGLQAAGVWEAQRGSNILDGGAPFMRPYKTKDQQYIVIGALEDRFYQRLLDLLDIDDAELRRQRHDKAYWPALRSRLQAVFITRTREQWCELFAGSEACFSPVLSLDEASHHEHANARAAYVDLDGIRQPVPAPRFQRTPSAIQGPPARRGENSMELLAQWGFSEQEIAALIKEKAITQTREPG